jgi:hypothetical protein
LFSYRGFIYSTESVHCAEYMSRISEIQANS